MQRTVLKIPKNHPINHEQFFRLLCCTRNRSYGLRLWWCPCFMSCSRSWRIIKKNLFSFSKSLHNAACAITYVRLWTFFLSLFPLHSSPFRFSCIEASTNFMDLFDFDFDILSMFTLDSMSTSTPFAVKVSAVDIEIRSFSPAQKGKKRLKFAHFLRELQCSFSKVVEGFSKTNYSMDQKRWFRWSVCFPPEHWTESVNGIFNICAICKAI